MLLHSRNVARLPIHEVPFPVKPTLQVQKKDPSVLVQFEFRSQLSVDSEHSSMSINEKLVPIMFWEFPCIFLPSCRIYISAYY